MAKPTGFHPETKYSGFTAVSFFYDSYGLVKNTIVAKSNQWSVDFEKFTFLIYSYDYACLKGESFSLAITL